MTPLKPQILMLLSSLVVVLGSPSFAADAPLTDYGYPHALANKQLCENLSLEKDRKIPQSEWACATVDGHVYLRALGTEEFYHGVGHWVQLRSQFRATENFVLNMRTIFYSGSISYGYTRPLGFYNLIGFTAQWPESLWGGDSSLRLMDLERQTLGAGLLIQDHETAGLLFQWNRGDWNFRAIGDGTGGLILADDLKAYEVSWRNRALSLGYIEWTEGTQGQPPFREPMGYASSEIRWGEYFGSDFEVGLRAAKWAGLVRLKAFWQNEAWKTRLVLQGRNYDKGFGEQFVRKIEHMYTSYDQYDKDFTSAANIFSVGDNVQVASVNLDLVYKINDHYELQSLNEVGRFMFRDFDAYSFHFYRLGMAYKPKAEESGAIVAFLSNKVLVDSLRLPPYQDSSLNTYFFKQFPFIGIEGHFQF